MRRLFWRAMKWSGRGYTLDTDGLREVLVDALVNAATMRVMASVPGDQVLEAMERLVGRAEIRAGVLVERVIEAVEAEGLAVPGVEGSLDRVLERVVRSANDLVLT